jgi:hypothetical protein
MQVLSVSYRKPPGKMQSVLHSPAAAIPLDYCAAVGGDADEGSLA